MRMLCSPVGDISYATRWEPTSITSAVSAKDRSPGKGREMIFPRAAAGETRGMGLAKSCRHAWPCRAGFRKRGVKRKKKSLSSGSSLTSMPHLYSSSAISSAVHTRSSCLWCPPQASVSEANAARTSGAHPLLIVAVEVVLLNLVNCAEAGVAYLCRAGRDQIRQTVRPSNLCRKEQ